MILKCVILRVFKVIMLRKPAEAGFIGLKFTDEGYSGYLKYILIVSLLVDN